jgi:hypothetical protein
MVGVTVFLGLISNAYQLPTGIAKVTEEDAVTAVFVGPLAQEFPLNATPTAHRLKASEPVLVGEKLNKIDRAVIATVPVFRI